MRGCVGFIVGLPYKGVVQTYRDLRHNAVPYGGGEHARLRPITYTIYSGIACRLWGENGCMSLCCVGNGCGTCGGPTINVTVSRGFLGVYVFTGVAGAQLRRSLTWKAAVVA